MERGDDGHDFRVSAGQASERVGRDPARVSVTCMRDDDGDHLARRRRHTRRLELAIDRLRQYIRGPWIPGSSDRGRAEVGHAGGLFLRMNCSTTVAWPPSRA